MLHIDRGNNRDETSLFSYNKPICFEPPTGNSQYYNYLHQISTDVIESHRRRDTIWSLLKSFSVQSGEEIPTWTAYNSLLTSEKPKTTVQQLPIIHGSPTAWENLYCAIKETEKLKNRIHCDGKTIVSFDLQLYAKALRLQVKPDIRNNYVFRMGELHVVFTALKVLGKVINGSGLDQAFEEAGIKIKDT